MFHQIGHPPPFIRHCGEHVIHGANPSAYLLGHPRPAVANARPTLPGPGRGGAESTGFATVLADNPVCPREPP